MSFTSLSKRAFQMISPFLFQFVLSQDGYLKHFERKTILKEIILPNDSFREVAYKIPFPKEIYNSGEIELKKPNFQSIKLISVALKFDLDVYKEASYCIKNNNKLILFSYLEEKNTLSLYKINEINDKNKTCYIIKPYLVST